MTSTRYCCSCKAAHKINLIFTFLLSKYYLLDVGYLIPVNYLGLYRCEHYHLLDFRPKVRFANYNEITSNYHSNLRCTIE